MSVRKCDGVSFNTGSVTPLPPPQPVNSATKVFFSSFLTNFFLAIASVPSETMAVRRIINRLENSNNKPSYYSTIKKIGLKALLQGAISRVIYCLTGNFFTIQGVYYLGSDPKSLFLIACGKNSLLPLSLFCNARQGGFSYRDSLHFLTKGVRDPVVHLSFFLRNLIANSCLAPGFMVRDYLYQSSGEVDTKIPTLSGYTTSVLTSAIMNTFLKPFFTGKFPFQNRYQTAFKLHGLVAILLREAASIGLVFANTFPQKRQVN